jgi:hypothetical protein
MHGACDVCGGKGEVHTEFWLGDHLEDPGVDRIVLKRICSKWDGDMDCSIWLRIGTD